MLHCELIRNGPSKEGQSAPTMDDCNAARHKPYDIPMTITLVTGAK